MGGREGRGNRGCVRRIGMEGGIKADGPNAGIVYE